MSTTRRHQTTTATPEQFVAGLTVEQQWRLGRRSFGGSSCVSTSYGAPFLPTSCASMP
jgi:hypothetical protein